VGTLQWKLMIALLDLFILLDLQLLEISEIH